MPNGVFSRLDRTLPGDSVVVRDPAGVRLRRSSQTITPGPNAPLLMRIVRHPYALSAGRPARRGYRSAPDAVGHRPTPFPGRPARFPLRPDEA